MNKRRTILAGVHPPSTACNEWKTAGMFEKATLEDNIVDIITTNFNNLVLHGGTAIWRCHNGNRFSTDLDFFANAAPAEMNSFKKQFSQVIDVAGLQIQKERISSMHGPLINEQYLILEENCPTVNGMGTTTLHLTLSSGQHSESVDVTFMAQKVKKAPSMYLRTDGSKLEIYTIPPEALLREKIDKYYDYYIMGKHKIQDLYDIAFLVSKLNTLSENIIVALNTLISKITNNPPKNENELITSLIRKDVPTFSELIYIIESETRFRQSQITVD